MDFVYAGPSSYAERGIESFLGRTPPSLVEQYFGLGWEPGPQRFLKDWLSSNDFPDTRRRLLQMFYERPEQGLPFDIRGEEFPTVIEALRNSQLGSDRYTINLLVHSALTQGTLFQCSKAFDLSLIHI